MSRRYATYGFQTASLEEAVSFVESALGISMSERDSSYYAGSYYNYRVSTGRGVQLYRNRDSVRGGLVHEHYRDYSVILEVSDLDDMEKVQRKLTELRPDLVLLDSKELPDEPGASESS